MKVAIYCGSAKGNNPNFVEGIKALAAYFAGQEIEVIYGGGKVGLMGEMADAMLAAGGKVTGVITKHLEDKEIAHANLTDLYVVEDMHERKAKMAELADVFVALPGGVGTLEEIFEVWTWAQIGLHEKPCAFYNIEHFYDPLFTMVDSMRDAGFVKPQYVDMLIRADTPEDLVAAFQDYHAPAQKWA